MSGGKYGDIIGHGHHVSSRHPRMSMYSRAAQFSPFAALSGYDEVIGEEGRLTEERIFLAEDEKHELDIRLRSLAGKEKVSVTFFREDGRKSGGAYVTFTGIVKSFDTAGGEIVFTDGTRIAAGSVIGIDTVPEPPL